jgi:hypothetical protein
MKCPHCGKEIKNAEMKEEMAEPRGRDDEAAERSPRSAITRAVTRSRRWP